LGLRNPRKKERKYSQNNLESKTTIIKQTIKKFTTCGSVFEPGDSGLPYYCTPPVCVPALLGALTVWQLSKKPKIEITNYIKGHPKTGSTQLVQF